MKEVKFKQMKDGDKEDYLILKEFEDKYIEGTAPRIIQALKHLDASLGGYQVSRLEHSLQTASRALRDQASEEMIVASLLHDIGDELAPHNHSEFAAAILKPFVSKKTCWIIEKHGIFQMYYYAHHYNYNKDEREKYRNHPFFDEWKSGEKGMLRAKLNLNQNDKVLVLFPGSRIQELQRHLDLFIVVSLLVKKKIPELKIILGLAPNLSKKYLSNIPSDIRIESDNPQEVLECADAAIIASGTATVEAAIFNIPSVIVYKSSFISWLIAKTVIKTPFIGMANLIADELVMPEFLQYNAKPEIIANQIIPLLLEENKSIVIKRKLERIKQKLGAPGASIRAAKLILQE